MSTLLFNPYHVVSGKNITIYLNVVADSDSTLGPPIVDEILKKLNEDWNPIAIVHQLTITFAFGSTTDLPEVIPPGIQLLDGSNAPNSPGLNVMTGAAPPSGVDVFNFTVGRGKSADKETRSSLTSYVKYRRGTGYIYQLPTTAALLGPDISHELGHVLGLSDRYYDGVIWFPHYAIHMTCKEIREGKWIDGGVDRRKGMTDPSPDPNINASAFPRLALRVTLPIRIAGESSFHNLMSDGTATLTTNQVDDILARDEEETYRKKNWVAILGDWDTYPQALKDPHFAPSGAPPKASGTSPGWLETKGPERDKSSGGDPNEDMVTGDNPLMPATEESDPTKWRYPVREPSTSEGGKGLVIGSPEFVTLRRYACVKFLGKGRGADGAVEKHVRLGLAMGKRWLVGLNGRQKTSLTQRHWMCYARRLIHDLRQP